MNHRITLLVTIYLIFHVNVTSAHLYDIIKVDTKPTYSDAMSPNKLFNFMSGGVPQIFWTFVNSSQFNQINFLGSPCKSSLLAVSSGFDDSLLTSYRFLDSSGKTPSGLIRATMSSFGDYDECLSIEGEIEDINLKGQYCAFDIFPTHTMKGKSRSYSASKISTNETLSLDRVAVFEGIPFIHSLCLPSQCSVIEVRQILKRGKLTNKNCFKLYLVTHTS